MITIKNSLPRSIKGSLTTSGFDNELDTKIAADENIQAGGFVFKTDNPKYIVGLKEGATSDDVLGVAVRTPYRTPNNPNGCNYYASGTDIVISTVDKISVEMDTDSKAGDRVYVNPSTGVISSESYLANKINFLSKVGEEATPAVLTFPDISSFENWKTAKTGFFEFIVDGKHIKTYVDFSNVKSISDIANAFNNNRDLNTVLSTSTTSDNLGLVFTTKSKGKDSNVSLFDVNSPFDSFLLSTKEEDGAGGGINPAQLSFFYQENDYYLDNYRAVVDGTITVLIGDQSIESAKLDFSRVNNLDDVVSEFNGDDNLRNLLTCEHVSEGNRHQIVFKLKKSNLGSKITLKDWSNYKMLMALTGSKYSEYGTDGDIASIRINVNSDILSGIKEITNGRVNFRFNDEFLFVDNLDFSKISNIRDIANVFNSNETFASRFSCEMGDISEDEYGTYIETIFRAKNQGTIDIVDLSSPMFDLFTRKTNQEQQDKQELVWIQGEMPAVVYWRSVAYGNGKFVAIAGLSSVFAYSTDGINWIQGEMPKSYGWFTITYCNDRFVAVANNSNICAYSTDGINWIQGEMPVNSHWISITYGDGKFVAVAYSSNISAYSTDGINWTQGTLPISANWYSVAYGNGRFVAVAEKNNICVYSTDGINWVQENLPAVADWISITYGDGKFVAVAYSSNISAYSTDGINWTQGTLPISANWYSVAYGNDRFIAIATPHNLFAYSTDGINWIQGEMPVSANWISITYGDGKFVAIAAINKIMAYYLDSKINSSLSFSCSSSLDDWKNNNPLNMKLETNADWRIEEQSHDRTTSIAYGNGRFLCAVSGGELLRSSNAKDWEKVEFSVNVGWIGVIYGNGKFVNVGDKLFSSYGTDGLTWTRTNGLEREGAMYTRIRYNANSNMLLAISDRKNGSIYFDRCSVEDTKWLGCRFISAEYFKTTSEEEINNETSKLRSFNSIICIDSSNYIAIGDGNSCLKNLNDINDWNYISMPSDANWISIDSGINNKNQTVFLAIAQNSNLFAYSIDNGATWTQGNLPAEAEWTSVAYGNGRFVAVANSSNICAYMDINGDMSWNQITMFQDRNNWQEIVYGYDRFIAMTDNNISAYSTNGESWTRVELPLENESYSITYGSGRFVAMVYNSDEYFYSADGNSWERGKKISIAASCNSVAFGNGRFLISFLYSIYYGQSSDGINWDTTLKLPQLPKSSRDILYLATGKFVNSMFIFFAKSKSMTGSYLLASSTDGINWKLSIDSFPMSIIIDYLYTYGNGQFIVGELEKDSYYYSSDGINFEKKSLPEGSKFGSITYGRDKFICTQPYNSTYYYSYDGSNWLAGELPKPHSKGYWIAAIYGGGIYIIASTHLDGYVFLYSTDGINWVARKSPIDIIYSVSIDTFSFSGDFFLISSFNTKWILYAPSNIITVDKDIDFKNADSFGTIANTLKTSFDSKLDFNFNSPKNDRLTISPNYEIDNFDLDFLNFSIANPLVWTKNSMSSSAIWQPVEYCKDRFLSFASDNNIFTYSTDGINWKQKTLPTPFAERYNWRHVAYGRGSDNVDRFVAVGYGQFSAYSIDGENWERKQISQRYINWYSIAYGNNMFIAKTYDNDNYVTSQDGQVWSDIRSIGITLSQEASWQLITFVKDRFIILINAGTTYAYSTDGINWTQGTLPISANWFSVAYGNGRFVAVAYNSKTVAYGFDGVNWKTSEMPESAGWQSVTYGSGRFVAIARNSNISAYSYDGENWIIVEMKESTSWDSIAYGANKFVAINRGNSCEYSDVTGIADDPRSISKVLGWKTDTTGNGMGSSPYANIPGFCSLERIKAVNNGEISINVNGEKLEAKGLDFSSATEETVSDVFSDNEALHGKVNVSLAFNESENGENSLFRVWNDRTGSSESITDIRGSISTRDVMGNILPIETSTGSISPKTPALLTFPYALFDSAIERWKTITEGKLSLRENKTIIEMDRLDFSNIISIEDILKVFETSLNDRLKVRITSDGNGLEFSTNNRGEGTTLVYLDSSDDVFKNLGAVSYEEGTGGDEPIPGDVIDTGFIVVSGGKAKEPVEICIPKKIFN